MLLIFIEQQAHCLLYSFYIQRFTRMRVSMQSLLVSVAIAQNGQHIHICCFSISLSVMNEWAVGPWPKIMLSAPSNNVHQQTKHYINIVCKLTQSTKRALGATVGLVISDEKQELCNVLLFIMLASIFSNIVCHIRLTYKVPHACVAMLACFGRN